MQVELQQVVKHSPAQETARYASTGSAARGSMQAGQLAAEPTPALQLQGTKQDSRYTQHNRFQVAMPISPVACESCNFAAGKSRLSKHSGITVSTMLQALIANPAHLFGFHIYTVAEQQ